MNKTELINVLAEKMGSTKKAAGETLDAVVDTFTDVLKSGDDVNIMGFGRFTIKENAARIGRNPATGDSIEIPASKSVKFKVAKALKDSVNA